MLAADEPSHNSGAGYTPPGFKHNKIFASVGPSSGSRFNSVSDFGKQLSGEELKLILLPIP